MNGQIGNLVGFDRAAVEIKFVSFVGGPEGFTIDDLTFGDGSGQNGNGSVPLPMPIVAGLIGTVCGRSMSAA